MKFFNMIRVFAAAILGAGAGFCPANAQELPSKQEFPSKVVPQSGAVAEPADWGIFYTYFQGRSFGAEDVLTGVAEIKPGREIHPPHAHAEEEFLMVMEGEGEWSLNGDSFPAAAGDILYARPWDVHGVKNTGDRVLKFVVWKWLSKDAPAPDAAEVSGKQ